MYWPAIVFFVIAVAIAIHHGFKHYPDTPENKHAHEESCEIICYLQPSDVSNHETYVVLFLGMCVTWIAATAFYC